MKNDIDFPSLEEINVEVNEILNKGLKKKKGFFSYITLTIKELGIKNIFHDKSELVFISVVSLIFFVFIGGQVALSSLTREGYIHSLYGYIFIVSPVLYVIISLFSFINTRLKSTYEVEMTCKYNMYNLAAIRMFIFSIVGIVFNSLAIAIIYFAFGKFNVIRAYVVSIGSLFLFSTIFIITIVYLKGSIYKYLVMIGWLLINLILIINENSLYITFITNVPVYIHLIITAICMSIYIKVLKKLIYVKKEKGEI
ncbi:hypothetical protein [Clostridium lundense]|uniref:hypothetical protein n=1 Tax=Clostridium lundense TaxID=319475 RepID=UPI0006870FDF|nr:hypothetical protein [Clostridium lundense]